MLKTRGQKAAFAVAAKSKGIKKSPKETKEKLKRKENKTQRLKRSLSSDDMVLTEEKKTAPVPC